MTDNNDDITQHPIQFTRTEMALMRDLLQHNLDQAEAVMPTMKTMGEAAVALGAATQEEFETAWQLTMDDLTRSRVVLVRFSTRYSLTDPAQQN